MEGKLSDDPKNRVPEDSDNPTVLSTLTTPPGEKPKLERLRLGNNGPLLDRAYQLAPKQYLREIPMNSIQAWQIACKKGYKEPLNIWVCPDFSVSEETANRPEGPLYLFTVQDNGPGMSEEDFDGLADLSRSGAGRVMEGLGANFGMGARTSTLSGNPAGAVFETWQNGEGTQIRFIRDTDGEYGACKGEYEDEESNVKTSYILPSHPAHDKNPDGTDRLHGTMFIAMGEGDHSTWLSFKKGEQPPLRTIIRYLQRRFFTIPDGVTLKTFDSNYQESGLWARSLSDFGPPTREEYAKYYDIKPGDPDPTTPKGLFRTIRGAKYYLDKNATKCGSTEVKAGENPATVHWWFFDENSAGFKSINHADLGRYVIGIGETGVVREDEVYGLENNWQRLRSFGFFQSTLRKQLVLLVEPKPECQVYPNELRTEVVCLKSVDRTLPWTAWADDFSQHLPQFLKDKIAEISAKESTVDPLSLEDLKNRILKEAASLVSPHLRSTKRNLNKDASDKTKRRPRRRLGGKSHGTGSGLHKHKGTYVRLELHPTGSDGMFAEYHGDTKGGRLDVFLDYLGLTEYINRWVEPLAERYPNETAQVRRRVTDAAQFCFATLVYFEIAEVLNAIHTGAPWDSTSLRAGTTPEALTFAVTNSWVLDTLMSQRMSPYKKPEEF